MFWDIGSGYIANPEGLSEVATYEIKGKGKAGLEKFWDQHLRESMEAKLEVNPDERGYEQLEKKVSQKGKISQSA